MATLAHTSEYRIGRSEGGRGSMTATRSGNAARRSSKSNMAARPPPTNSTSYSGEAIGSHSTTRRGNPGYGVVLRDLVADVHVVLRTFEVEDDLRLPFVLPGGHRALGHLDPVHQLPP